MTDAPPEPTREEIAEWTRRSEEAKAHPETLVPLEELRQRLSVPPEEPRKLPIEIEEALVWLVSEAKAVGVMLSNHSRSLASEREKLAETEAHVRSTISRYLSWSTPESTSVPDLLAQLERLKAEQLTAEEARLCLYALESGGFDLKILNARLQRRFSQSEQPE